VTSGKLRTDQARDRNGYERKVCRILTGNTLGNRSLATPRMMLNCNSVVVFKKTVCENGNGARSDILVALNFESLVPQSNID
jgi:hypothetical protein